MNQVKQEGGTLGVEMTFYSVYNPAVQVTGYIQIPRKMMQPKMC